KRLTAGFRKCETARADRRVGPGLRLVHVASEQDTAQGARDPATDLFGPQPLPVADDVKVDVIGVVEQTLEVEVSLAVGIELSDPLHSFIPPFLDSSARASRDPRIRPSRSRSRKINLHHPGTRRHGMLPGLP